MTLLGRRIPPFAFRAAQIVVGFGLLAILWHAADGPEALRILASANPVWLAGAFAALTLQTVLSALRWRVTAAPLGIRLTAREAIREYYLAQIVNQSLPGGMVGDAGRAFRARAQAGLVASGQSVVFERLAGQVAMFTAMAIAFAITLFLPGGFEWPAWLVPVVALLLLAGAALPVVLLAATVLPGLVGRSMASLWSALRAALISRRVLPMQVLLSMGTTTCNLAAFAFCAWAVDAPLTVVATVALVPLILFTMLIPLSISGWGLREGAAAALFPVAGATAAQGLAASIAFGLVFILAVLPGVIPLWFGTKPAPARDGTGDLGGT